MPNLFGAWRGTARQFSLCSRRRFQLVPHLQKPFLISQCRRDFSSENSDDVNLSSYSHLRSITESDVRNLQAILNEDNLPSKVFLTSPEDTSAYLSDWTGQYRVSPKESEIIVVAQPTTVKQVSQIVLWPERSRTCTSPRPMLHPLL
jgi:hypothetical protein